MAIVGCVTVFDRKYICLAVWSYVVYENGLYGCFIKISSNVKVIFFIIWETGF